MPAAGNPGRLRQGGIKSNQIKQRFPSPDPAGAPPCSPGGVVGSMELPADKPPQAQSRGFQERAMRWVSFFQKKTPVPGVPQRLNVKHTRGH